VLGNNSSYYEQRHLRIIVVNLFRLATSSSQQTTALAIGPSGPLWLALPTPWQTGPVWSSSASPMDPSHDESTGK
jgi:hypothetical protein